MCDRLNGIGESCWCYIKSGYDKIIVGVICRSPNSSKIDNKRIIEYIESVSSVSSILIMGDFNYPDIDWSNGVVRTEDRDALNFSKVIQQQYLCQHVWSPTRRVSDN